MGRWMAWAALALLGCSGDGGGARDSGVEPGRDAGQDSGADAIDAGLDGAVGVDAGSDGGGEIEPLEVAEFETTAQTVASFGNCLADESPVLGYAPVGEGVRYPLLVWVVGTFATYNSEDVHLILREMASRGFVAVSPRYDNFIVNGCPNLREKTMCIFDAAQPGSVTARMCARPDVDCDRGIMVGGHSQGAGIGLLAKNYEERVRAYWGLATVCDYLFNQDTGLCNPDGVATDTTCMLDGETALSSDRLRITIGENDEYGTQVDLERVSGRDCPDGQLDCLEADGSGWYRVANGLTQDGDADHCFIINSTDGAWCPGIDAAHPFDTGWVPPAHETWSLATNLDWLQSFAGP